MLLDQSLLYIVGAMRGVRLSRVDQNKERNGVATQIRSRNDKYSTIRGRTNLLPEHVSRVQVWGREGVRHPTPPDLWVDFHSLCVTSYLIKGTFNICTLDSLSLTHTHTHTLEYIQQTTWHHIIPNPSIHLSCISSYLKLQRMPIIHGIISHPRQKRRHGSNQINILSYLRHDI